MNTLQRIISRAGVFDARSQTTFLSRKYEQRQKLAQEPAISYKHITTTSSVREI